MKSRIDIVKFENGKYGIRRTVKFWLFPEEINFLNNEYHSDTYRWYSKKDIDLYSIEFSSEKTARFTLNSYYESLRDKNDIGDVIES